MQVVITIPFPIKPKERPRKGKYGNFYTPKGTESAISQLAMAACARVGGTWPTLSDVTATLAIAGKRGRADLDNLAKGALDALNGIVYQDDRQVVELHVYRITGTESQLTISEVECQEVVTPGDLPESSGPKAIASSKAKRRTS